MRRVAAADLATRSHHHVPRLVGGHEATRRKLCQTPRGDRLSPYVFPEGFEPPTRALGKRSSGPLSYENVTPLVLLGGREFSGGLIATVLVDLRGFEPPPTAFGGRCSVLTELQVDKPRPRGKRLGNAGPPGIEPGRIGLQPIALPTELQTETVRSANSQRVLLSTPVKEEVEVSSFTTCSRGRFLRRTSPRRDSNALDHLGRVGC